MAARLRKLTTIGFDFFPPPIYYFAAMHAGFPDFVAASGAAAAGAMFAGTLSAATLPRLSDQLLNNDSLIEAQCRFYRDEQGRAAFRLHLSGTLPLECQRCRQMLHWPLSRDVDFRVVASETQAALIEDDAVEPCIALDGRVDLAATIEDEILLSLPFAPCHEAGCGDEAPGLPDVAKDERRSGDSPFAVLEQLRRQRGGE